MVVDKKKKWYLEQYKVRDWLKSAKNVFGYCHLTTLTFQMSVEILCVFFFYTINFHLLYIFIIWTICYFKLAWLNNTWMFTLLLSKYCPRNVFCAHLFSVYFRWLHLSGMWYYYLYEILNFECALNKGLLAAQANST